MYKKISVMGLCFSLSYLSISIILLISMSHHHLYNDYLPTDILAILSIFGFFAYTIVYLFFHLVFHTNIDYIFLNFETLFVCYLSFAFYYFIGYTIEIRFNKNLFLLNYFISIIYIFLLFIALFSLKYVIHESEYNIYNFKPNIEKNILLDELTQSELEETVYKDKTFNSFNNNYTQILAQNQSTQKIMFLPFSYKIVENNFYSKSFISRNDAFNRAFYWQVIKPFQLNIKTLDIYEYSDKYCIFSLFYKDKEDYCNYYQNTLKKVDIININNKKIVLKDIDNLKKLSLLGSMHAPEILLKKYDTDTDEYLFWLIIGAENGDKYLENELGQLLQNKTNHFTSEKLDILHLSVNQTYLRGEFWITKAKNQNN